MNKNDQYLPKTNFIIIILAMIIELIIILFALYGFIKFAKLHKWLM
jgi:flagellar biogenesis protein FliO